MQYLDAFLKACGSVADRNYAFPELVDVARTDLEIAFEDGTSPQDAVDAVAAELDLTPASRWGLDDALRVMAPFQRVAGANRRSS